MNARVSIAEHDPIAAPPCEVAADIGLLQRIFTARAEARAIFYRAGELDLQEAVDVLQAAAVESGLVRELGQDAVQHIMSEAFAPVRDYETESPATAPIEFSVDSTLGPKSEESPEGESNDTFWQACAAADAKAARQAADPRTERAIKGRAAFSTVEALIFDLRAGVAALDQPDTRRRLSELSDGQALEVGERARMFKPKIARPWSTDEILIFMRACEKAHDR